MILLTHRQRWRVNHVLSGRYPAISPNSPSAVTVGWVSLSTAASQSWPARSPRGRPSLRDFSRAQLELRPAAEKSKGGHPPFDIRMTSDTFVQFPTAANRLRRFTRLTNAFSEKTREQRGGRGPILHVLQLRSPPPDAPRDARNGSRDRGGKAIGPAGEAHAESSANCDG